MMQVRQMESTSPVPSQPPRPSQAPHRSSKPRESSGRPFPGPMLGRSEPPLDEKVYASPMPERARDRQKNIIWSIAASMKEAELSEAQKATIDEARAEMDGLSGIAPLTLFMSKLAVDLMPRFMDAYQAVQEELDAAKRICAELEFRLPAGDATKLKAALEVAESSISPKADFLKGLSGELLGMVSAKYEKIASEGN